MLDMGLPVLLGGEPGDIGLVGASRLNSLPTLAGAPGAGRAGQPVGHGNGVLHLVSAGLPLSWVFSQKDLTFPRNFNFFAYAF